MWQRFRCAIVVRAILFEDGVTFIISCFFGDCFIGRGWESPRWERWERRIGMKDIGLIDILIRVECEPSLRFSKYIKIFREWKNQQLLPVLPAVQTTERELSSLELLAFWRWIVFLYRCFVLTRLDTPNQPFYSIERDSSFGEQYTIWIFIYSFIRSIFLSLYIYIEE